MTDAGINIRISADPAPAEAGFNQAADAAEKYTVKAAAFADKNVRKQLEQYEAIKKQASAYADIARSAEDSSAKQVIALKLLQGQLDKLARATGGDALIMKEALNSVRDGAVEATSALGDVKLDGKNAEETNIVGDLIDRKLSEIQDKAEATHRSLLRVRLSGVGGGIGSIGSALPLAGAGVGAAATALPTLGPAALGLGLGGLAMGTPLVGAGAVGLLALSGGQMLKKLKTDLKPLETILERLKTLAINDLVPAFQKAFKTLDNPNLIKAMSIVVNDFAKALGQVVNVIAKYVGSRHFAIMMAEWANAGARILPILTKASITFMDAMGKLLLAFMPLATWFAKLLDKGAKWLDTTITTAQKTGELTKMMHDCKTMITALGKVLGVFFQGLGVVIKGIDLLWKGFKDLVGQKAPIIGMVVAVGSILTLTLGPEAAAIVGVIAAIGLIKDHWTWLKKEFKKLTDDMANFFINNFINPMIKALDKLINGYNKFFGWATGNIGTINLMNDVGGPPKPGTKAWMQKYGQYNHPGKDSAAGSVVAEAKAYGVGSGGIYKTGGGHGGRVKPGSALDCSGYVYQVFTAAGFKDFPGTSEDQWKQQSGPNWASEHITINAAKPGDVVFMVGSSQYPPPGHVGIVVSGSGSNARIMQYYQSGKPPATFGWTTDTMGVKRFFLIKKAAGGKHGGKHGGSPSSSNPLNNAPTLPSHTTPLTKPKATHHTHKTAAQVAATHARNVITVLLGTSKTAQQEAHAQNAAALALAHASAEMQAASKTKDPVKAYKDYAKAYSDYQKAKKDDEKALKAEEKERKELEQKIKHSSGKAKQEYEAALKKVNKNITSTQSKIVQAGQDMATATADKLQILTTILQNIETAVDAQFEAQIAPLQAQLNALQQQATVSNDAFTISQDQNALAAAMASGSTEAIAQAQQALQNAKNQQQQNQLQAQITTIQQNEAKFNAAIEAMITQINGTGPESVSSAMAELASTVGSGSNLFKNLTALLTQYLPAGSDSGGGGGSGGGSGGGTGGGTGGGGGGGCFTAETLVMTPSGDVMIHQLEAGNDVMVWSFGLGQLVPAPVKEVIVHDPQPTLILTFVSGRIVNTTKEHPFLSAEAWRPAGDLVPGDSVAFTIGGTLAQDQLVSSEVGPTQVVYNLHIDHHDHNYFAGGCLVHNMLKMASGGIVRRPTFALIGEKGPEAVVPLNHAGAIGAIHIHLDGPVIGTGLDRAAKELADPIYREFLKQSKRNIGLGFA